MKTLFALFLLFPNIVFASKANHCSQLLSPLEKGFALFQGEVDVFNAALIQTSYLHGTSVQSLARISTPELYPGSPVRAFSMLSGQFEIYNEGQVHHVYGSSSLSPNIKESIRHYASLSAFRYSLDYQFNKLIEKDNFFLYELYTATENMAINDVIRYLEDSYKGLELKPPSKESLNELAQAVVTAHQYRGVLILLKKELESEFPVEQDPEDEMARAVFSTKGLPYKYIKAIIPLSIKDKQALEELIR